MRRNVIIITEEEEKELAEMLHEAEWTLNALYLQGFSEEKLNYTRGCCNAFARMLDKLGIEH